MLKILLTSSDLNPMVQKNVKTYTHNEITLEILSLVAAITMTEIMSCVPMLLATNDWKEAKDTKSKRMSKIFI